MGALATLGRALDDMADPLQAQTLVMRKDILDSFPTHLRGKPILPAVSKRVGQGDLAVHRHDGTQV
ncbi:hypothetical protein B7H23_04555 [Notoacmeibacter marinus]|uniref:Uncharacterized protein n=1 Tax=Notoacmeibacter marinus TaxID=1876515 RepID=A0A231V1W9_9HYPH|nr:hypothetical protein B7H23_04555 [Notoacmeibacter marinus]